MPSELIRITAGAAESDDTDGLLVITSDFLEVYITVSKERLTNVSTKRFRRDLTVAELKQRLELMTGRNSNSMTVYVLNKDYHDICKLLDDDRAIGSYPINNGMIFYVDDAKYKSEFEDDCIDNRYTLSEDQYNNRRGTLKEFLLKNKIGKYGENDINEKELERGRKIMLEQKEKEEFEFINIGGRCQVIIPGQLPKRGVVMFKGEVQFQTGLWIGVKYDEPVGKNDGSVKGIRYFVAPPKYGAFVKPSYVQMGDFPELNEFDSDTEF